MPLVHSLRNGQAALCQGNQPFLNTLASIYNLHLSIICFYLVLLYELSNSYDSFSF